MGWTGIHATHYKRGGINRKAECDSLFNDDMVNRERQVIGKFEVLKSTMVGSVYYAAVKRTKFATETEPEDSKVFAAVCLTSIDRKDYFNFSYKDMDESCGPCYYDCPKGILDLLSPTENEWVNNWRAKCRENLEKKKDPNALSNLPVGTIIQVTMPFDTKYFTEGDVVKLRKDRNGRTNRTAWYVAQMSIKFTQSLMKLLEGHYEIIKRGE